MGWQFTPYTLPILLAGVISVAVMIPVVRNRDQRTALPLLGFLVGTTIWCFTAALQLSRTTLDGKLFWIDVGFVGTAGTTAAFFLLAATVTDRRQWLRTERVGGLCLIELIIGVAIWTNPWHKLALTEIHLDAAGSYVVVDSTFGPVLQFSIVFQYLLLAVSSYWLLLGYWQARKNRNDLQTKQMGLMVVALLLPWAASIPFVGGLIAVNVTPIAFAVSGLCLAVALYRYRLLDLLPIARDTVVESMDNGVFVLDTDDQIVDCNARAREMFCRDGDPIGTKFQGVFADTPSITAAFVDVRETREQVTVQRNGTECHYDVTVSPITDSFANDIGRTIVFNDITAQVEREQQLRAREQELDLMRQVFSRVLRHNIRNDLQIVKTRNEVLAADLTGENQKLAESTVSVVDDLVALSNKARSVEELVEDDQSPREIDLAATLRDLVETARTDYPAVSFATDLEECAVEMVPAIRIVFENLIENAAEHGSATDPTVTVTLDRIDDSVQVTISDNGPGIPDQELAVIDQGEETDLEHGSGLGLWVVNWVIDNSNASIQYETGRDGTDAIVTIPL